MLLGLCFIALTLLVGCQKTTTTTTSKKVINTTTTSTLNQTELGTVYYLYALDSTIDMMAQIPIDSPIVRIINEETEAELVVDVDYQLQTGYFILKSLYLAQFAEPILHHFRIYTSEGYYHFNLAILIIFFPYMMNVSSLDVIPETDVFLCFDLMGGTLVSVESIGISHDDYWINGNYVQIDKFYISQYFVNHPTQNFLTIYCYYTYESSTQSAHFTIKKS